MTYKRLISALLAGLLLLTGCTVTPVPTVTPESSDPEVAFKFLGLMVGDSFLEEWHGGQGTCTVRWDSITLEDEDAKQYPNLQATFDALSANAKADAKDMLDEFNSTIGDFDSETNLEATAEILPQRADETAVSCFESVFVYSGGVHGNYAYRGYNFDPESGEALTLDSVMTDISALPELLAGKLVEKYDEVALDNVQEVLSYYDAETYVWTIDYDGITFWFAPYELASFAAGLLSAKVYYEERPDLFASEYTKAPDAYALTLLADHEMEFGYKSPKKVFSGTRPDEYGSYQMLNVVVDGETYNDEINYAYSFDRFLVYSGGKYYLYCVSYSDGDYNELVALDLNGGVSEIMRLKDTQFVSEARGDAEDFVVFRPFFNDPTKFSLTTRLELLGTRQGVATYSVSALGLPERQEDHYRLDGGFAVTTKIPMDAKLLPEGGETEIVPGVELTPIRTDGATYVDVRLPDGTEAQLTVDLSGWPKLVNGMPEEDCFENIMYAG